VASAPLQSPAPLAGVGSEVEVLADVNDEGFDEPTTRLKPSETVPPAKRSRSLATRADQR
jgi:hypothetical protein